MVSIENFDFDALAPVSAREPASIYTLNSEIVSPTIQILLVDSLTMERAGLQMLLSGEPDFELVGSVGDLTQAAEMAGTLNPHIVVVALSETNHNSLADLRKIVQAAPETRIIVLCRTADTDLYIEAVKNGALGVILKAEPPEVLPKVIRKVREGEAWLDRTTVASVLSSISRNPPAKDQEEWSLVKHLTQREREIVKMIGQGLNTRKIAKRLFMSESTIRHHLTSIYEKVGVTSRLELLIFAYRTGLEHSSS